MTTFGSHNVAFDGFNLDKLHKLAQAKIPAPGDNLKRRRFEYSNPFKELVSIINPMLKAGDDPILIIATAIKQIIELRPWVTGNIRMAFATADYLLWHRRPVSNAKPRRGRKFCKGECY